MKIHNVLTPLPVAEFTDAVDWYTALLGREADAAPMSGVAEWRFPGGGWLQLYEDAARAGQGAATLVVADIAAVRILLGEVGHNAEIMDSEVTSLAIIADPDGNRLVFAESRDARANPSAAAGH